MLFENPPLPCVGHAGSRPSSLGSQKYALSFFRLNVHHGRARERGEMLKYADAFPAIVSGPRLMPRGRGAWLAEK